MDFDAWSITEAPLRGLGRLRIVKSMILFKFCDVFKGGQGLRAYAKWKVNGASWAYIQPSNQIAATSKLQPTGYKDTLMQPIGYKDARLQTRRFAPPAWWHPRGPADIPDIF